MSNEPILPPWLEVEDDEEELEYPYPARTLQVPTGHRASPAYSPDPSWSDDTP